MSFIVFLLITAGTRDGPGQSYEETCEVHDASDIRVGFAMVVLEPCYRGMLKFN